MDAHTVIAALRKENEYLRSVINAFPAPMIAVGVDYKVKLANREARSQHFVDTDELGRAHCYELFHKRNTPCAGKDHPCPLDEVVRTGEPVTTVHKHYRDDGRTVIVKLEASPIFDPRGNLVGILENVRDITAQVEKDNKQRKKVARLIAMAHRDPLTRLPNRALFKDRLNHTVCKARRYGKKFAVLYIDIDHFKEINDTWGHDAGDVLLNILSARFKRCLRESDTVARMGGDEFVMIVDELKDPRGVLNVARKILDEVAKPISYNDHVHTVSTSIGISLFPMHAKSADDLMACADRAMYHAKRTGQNHYKMFQWEMAPVKSNSAAG